MTVFVIGKRPLRIIQLKAVRGEMEKATPLENLWKHADQLNMRFGLYLSPWDRHEPKYKDKDAYNKFYISQLEELLRDYAEYDEIFELWFDGAGRYGKEYDWPSIMAVVKQYQPHAMIFNMGDLTIRWAGNEHGFANYPLWDAVYSAQKLKFSDGKGGSGIDGDQFIPAECDVPIRLRFWFHHGGFFRNSL